MMYTETDILNYVEGRLDDAVALQFEEAMKTDNDLSASVDAMRASYVPVKAAYAQHASPSMPLDVQKRLLNAIETAGSDAGSDSAEDKDGNCVSDSIDSSIDAEHRHSAVQNKLPAQVDSEHFPRSHRFSGRKMTLLASAACLCIGLGFGAVLGFGMQDNQLNTDLSAAAITDDGTVAGTGTKTADQHAIWVKRVADYQSLYTENTVAKLSSSRLADANSLLEGIALQSDLSTAIPDLTAHGYDFVRAQHLGFEGDSLVQLVYRKPGVAPLALCYMPANGLPDRELSVDIIHKLGTASWISEGQQFVLVADESASVLTSIHNTAQAIF